MVNANLAVWDDWQKKEFCQHIINILLVYFKLCTFNFFKFMVIYLFVFSFRLEWTKKTQILTAQIFLFDVVICFSGCNSLNLDWYWCIFSFWLVAEKISMNCFDTNIYDKVTKFESKKNRAYVHHITNVSETSEKNDTREREKKQITN